MQCDYELKGIDAVQGEQRFLWWCPDCGHLDYTAAEIPPARECPAMEEGDGS